MVTLNSISRAVFVLGTGVALTFGVTSAAASARIPDIPPHEPTEECMESGGWASCSSPAACAYACRYYGFPSGISYCNVSTRCCYCGS